MASSSLSRFENAFVACLTNCHSERSSILGYPYLGLRALNVGSAVALGNRSRECSYPRQMF